MSLKLTFKRQQFNLLALFILLAELSATATGGELEANSVKLVAPSNTNSQAVINQYFNSANQDHYLFFDNSEVSQFSHFVWRTKMDNTNDLRYAMELIAGPEGTTKLGINHKTAAPSYTLDVRGQRRALPADGGNPYGLIETVLDDTATNTLRSALARTTGRWIWTISDEALGGANYNVPVMILDGNRYTTPSAGLQLLTVAGVTAVQISANGNTYFNGGNIGIGTNSPTAKLDVDGKAKIRDVLQLPPRSQPSTATEGDVYYDSSAKKLKIYNGTAWKTVQFE